MLFTRFELSNGALADFLHSRDLEVVLKDGVSCELFEALWVVDASDNVVLVVALELFFDLLVGGLGILLQHDELLRDDAHLLECDSLNLSSGEALDDPALLFCLHDVDLRANKLYNDLVLDVGVISA